MRRFEFKEGSSSKFWEATLSDNKLTVCYGRIGSPGQEKSNTFPRPEFAKKEHDKLIADKLRKGYKEVAASEAGPSAAKSKSATDILGALKQCEPLKRVAKQLESLQRLSLRITTKAVKGTSEGASKLGGRPDLPAGISWPIGKVAGREIALPFIAQFDVAWLWRSYIGPGAIGLLPTSGMLYFFYNMADY
jgi:predicted DNA-binding WGR domain protein